MKRSNVIHSGVRIKLEIIALIIFLSLLFSNRGNSQFIIGTYWDPCLSGNQSQDISKFQKAKDAYFNLLTGTQDPGNIDHLQAGMDYALSIAAQVGLKYMVSDSRYYNNQSFDDKLATHVVDHYVYGLNSASRNAMYGYNIKDEVAEGMASNIKDWINHFKLNDASKLAYINLLPSYGFSTKVDYENYLDLYLNDSNPNNNPNVVSFDHYPFLTTGARNDYFYNLDIIRKKAGTRPFWAYPLTVHHTFYVNPDENHIRFMVFCPIAYGAKGLIYFTYERPISPQWCGSCGQWIYYWDALINDCTIESTKYDTVKTINHYITNIVGPIVMNSTNLGAYHKSNMPTNESISTQQKINPKTPLVSNLSDDSTMVGIFRDNTISTTYYCLIVNKGLTSITNDTITLKGDYRSKITLAPSVVSYTGSTTYTTPSLVTYNSTTNKTKVLISTLAGGEGRIIKVTNVSDPQIATSNTDYDGDGSADMSVKTNDGFWKIDYARNGFNSTDFNLYSYAGYGGTTAHPVPADYDGDDKADISVKTDDGQWLVDFASNGFGSWDISNNPGYGGSTWHPVPADYDGDGKTDMAVKIDDGIGYWKIDYAWNGFSSSELNTNSYSWYGDASAHPVPADYDGDGKADLSVKTDDGRWLVDYARNGFGSWDLSNNPGYGGSTWRPVPADYDGDGIADMAVKIDTGIGYWKIDYAWNGFNSSELNTNSYSWYGDASAHPVPSDYDGDGKADLSVKTDGGYWLVDYAANGFGGWDVNNNAGYGGTSYNPLNKKIEENKKDKNDLNNLVLKSYPNPFNPTTIISYTIPSASHVEITVYDFLGREIQILVNEDKPAGKFEVQFDGTQLASGIYFCTMHSGLNIITEKILLLR